MTNRKKPTEVVALITGASSGIGKATAELLADRGYRVYGTSRKPELQENKFTMLMMDVTEPVSIINAVSIILDREKGIDVLINNAGMGIGGAVEETEITLAQKQMNIVFWGGVQVTRFVLPIMRENKKGLIINMSSVGGKIGLPYQGFYSAAKFALEGVSEALSMEVKPFGIKVVLVEPGDMATRFTANREWAVNENIPSPYLNQLKITRECIEKDETGGKDPSMVAKKILCIIRKKNPRFRYVVSDPLEKLAPALKNVIPFRLFEKLIASHYGIKS